MFFRNIQRLITEFIWAYKPARLRHEILRRIREKGGLGISDLKLYYLAS